MTHECPHCHALHWKAERKARSSERHPEYGQCCKSGKVNIPYLDNVPGELWNLFYAQDDISKEFRQNIRQYNNALAMTSVGGQVDNAVNNGCGPYVYKIHGEVHHRIGSLLPTGDNAPVFGQLYIYDPAVALTSRMQRNQNLNQQTMANIQDVLYWHHPGVQVYVQARELSRDIPAEQNFRIGLYFDQASDRRRYNLPTGANEIAAILPGDGDQVTGPRDIIVRLRGGGLRRISELDRNYYPLHYVVLFPTGQPQWHPNIPYRGANPD
ncbi:hypothetical protein HYDPIDRAFT_97011 [Hydnomerulius pinastri MD-312]|uniref:Helitron helicase-like domain-containing protein n=1 Tax=Hydnomerulius pinastri MD-312 TaxID=994086 RepID=A0A0C9W494_9AGAM|nr:hypothetical protein HYDPIDRAFT_97011 [Hydnomerulius pinastri MD-312]